MSAKHCSFRERPLLSCTATRPHLLSLPKDSRLEVSRPNACLNHYLFLQPKIEAPKSHQNSLDALAIFWYSLKSPHIHLRHNSDSLGPSYCHFHLACTGHFLPHTPIQCHLSWSTWPSWDTFKQLWAPCRPEPHWLAKLLTCQNPVWNRCLWVVV